MIPLSGVTMTRICVFTGSKVGAGDEYAAAATALGALLAARGHTVVYGGAQVGLMGVLADAVLAHGGEIVGVIPGHLTSREIPHRGLTELRVVDSMHQRKMTMSALCDGVVALPGGFGTLDELFETLTWAQLGLHRKPCGLLNVAGYFDALLAFLDHAVDRRFLAPEHRGMVIAETDGAVLLDRMYSFAPPAVEKWSDPVSP